MAPIRERLHVAERMEAKPAVCGRLGFFPGWAWIVGRTGTAIAATIVVTGHSVQISI